MMIKLPLLGTVAQLALHGESRLHGNHAAFEGGLNLWYRLLVLILGQVLEPVRNCIHYTLKRLNE